MPPEKLAGGEPASAEHNAPNSERTSAVHLGKQVDESGWDQMGKAPSALGPEPDPDAGLQNAAWPGPLGHCALVPVEQLAQTCDLGPLEENGEYGDTPPTERTAPTRPGDVPVSPLTSTFPAP